jgi:uncharacterized NAD(P)/FAD-binding protein YdhS
MRISIVGGGATGIAMLRHLAEQACSNRHRNSISEIQLFDKSGFDGGMAYRTQSDHHLLNMKVSTMSIRIGDAQDFLRWAKRVGLECAGNEHLPRKLYRGYLDDARESAIEHCRDAGISVHAEHAEVVQMHFSPDHDVVLKTDRNVMHESSVMILCTGHNAPDDHYGLAASPIYIPDPYSPFAFPDSGGIEVGILGTGLTAVDSLLALASSHLSVKMTCFSRSGLFPTVQAVTKPEVNGDFREALRCYVQCREQIEADDFASKISEFLRAFAGICCDLSCQDSNGDALAELERNIALARSCVPNIPSYLTGIVDVVCDAWSKMNRVEKARFMAVYNSGWLRNRSAMPLTNAVKILDLLRSARLSTISRLQNVVDVGGRFRAILRGGDSHDVDYLIAATGPSYRLNTSPFYLDMQRRGIVTLDELGGIACDYLDGRVLDGRGSKHRNIFAVGGPTKGTHFYAAAVDINLCRVESVINAILDDTKPIQPQRARPSELADA